jgi:hypothetical protein
VIEDLDKTLEVLLRRELPPALAGQVDISFAAPDDQFPPSSVTLPAIDLFLYDVRENRELRSNEWLVERQNDGPAKRMQPPTRIDCSYLITAWPSSSVPNPAQDEHRLLSAVIRVLLRYPKLPAEVLQDSLQNQELPLPASTLQPGHLQSLGEFWQAMGGKPKAAVNYTVTLGVAAPEAAEVPVVTEKVLKLRSEERS